MIKRNCYVKLSGDLVERDDVHEWLRRLCQKYFVVVRVGGGTQINAAFRKAKIKLRPHHAGLGRELFNLQQLFIVKNVLENNRDRLQAALSRKGIHATVEIPWAVIGGVECSVNGDTDVLVAYLGFQTLYVVTLDEPRRIKEKKRKFPARIYPKIQIKTFPKR